jgi:porin
MGAATYRTSIAGLTGVYGVRGIVSNREGPDFSQLIPSILGNATITKKGSWFVSAAMQQFLVQDQSNPARGWGIFAEIAKSDGNPNFLQWSAYVGFGGTGLVAGRPDDRFGVAYFKFGISEDLKSQLSLLTPLSPLFALTDQSGVELFYNVAVTPWLRVTADLQFIKPAQAAFPDAIYAGIATAVRF